MSDTDARTVSSARSTSGRLTHDQRATSEAGPAGYARDKAREAAIAGSGSGLRVWLPADL